MNRLLELIDEFSEKIPPNLMKSIRLGALVFWAGIAVIVMVYAWQYGVDHAPQVGQELHLTDVREKIQREKNLEKREHVTVPDIFDLPYESESNIPDMTERVRQGIAPLDEKKEDTSENSEFPPFMGESRSNVYPSEYIPEKDAGVGGVREKPSSNSEAIPLLSTVPGESGSTPESIEEHEESMVKNKTGKKVQGILRKSLQDRREEEPGLLPIR